MTTENNGAAPQQIPVPPGGGSWRFDEASQEWVSNDRAPAAGAEAAVIPSTIHAAEQEQ